MKDRISGRRRVKGEGSRYPTNEKMASLREKKKSEGLHRKVRTVNGGERKFFQEQEPGGEGRATYLRSQKEGVDRKEEDRGALAGTEKKESRKKASARY